MKCSTPLRRATIALLFAVFSSAIVHAGPPLICHAYDLGGAGWSTLPGGSSEHLGMDPAYDRSRLVADTLTLLTPATPVLVRMETLRRAAIYATNGMSALRVRQPYTDTDRALALGLLQKLRERAQNAMDGQRPLALFDLGFYAETLRQTQLDPALDGYELLAKVAELRPNDAEVQFALALASIAPERKAHSAHVAAAKAGAKPGTLLANNLRTHFPR